MCSQVTWRAKVSRSERISQTAERPRARRSPALCWHSSQHQRTRRRPKRASPTTGEVSNLATYTRSQKLQENWRQGTHESRTHPATLACMPVQVKELAKTCREEPGRQTCVLLSCPNSPTDEPRPNSTDRDAAACVKSPPKASMLQSTMPSRHLQLGDTTGRIIEGATMGASSYRPTQACATSQMRQCAPKNPIHSTTDCTDLQGGTKYAQPEL